jgi:hypothetical protein
VSLSNWPLKHLATVNAFSSAHFLLNRPFDKLRVRFFSQGPGNSVSEPVELAIIFCQGAGNSVSEPVELAIKTPCYS